MKNLWDIAFKCELSDEWAARAKSFFNKVKEEEMWVGRAQSLSDAFKTYIPNVQEMTVGRVLEVYSDKRVPNRDRTAMTDVFHLIPGFRPESIGNGLFHYAFIGQLEHLCNGLRLAGSRGMICR